MILKKITVLTVMALLCLNFLVIGQLPNPIKELQLGQVLPDTILKHPFKVTDHSGKITTIKLEAFKGKPLLLDFWATWCSNCINKFPLLDSLKKSYGDRIEIILVNANIKKDTPQKMSAKLGNYPNLQSIIYDELLRAYFPHRYIPHYVWLGSMGELLAITNSDWLNTQNIEHIIARDGNLKSLVHEKEN